MVARHRRQPAGDWAQWLRVGALTVGLGAAVTAGQGVAAASPTDTTDSAQSTNADGSATTETADTGATTMATGTSGSTTSSTSSSSTAPTSTVSAQQNTGDSTTSATETEKKSEQPAEANTQSARTATGSGSKDTPPEVETTAKSGGSHEAISSDSESKTPTSHTETAADVTAQTVSVRSAATAAVSAAAPATVSVTVPSTTQATAQPVAKTVAAQPATAAPVTVGSMVADVLTWMGWGGDLANGLRIPGGAPVPDLIAGLWLAVREAAYRVNNQRPFAQPTLSSQGPDGVYTGSVNATDYDDTNLTYAVSRAPEHGTLVVDKSGSFTYTPDSAWAATGGTDSFTITVDDTVGNPLHIHGLLGLIGQDGPTSATVTVTVSPAAITDKAIRTTAEAAQLLNGLAPLLGAAAGFVNPDNITIQHVGTTPGDVAETIYRLHETIDGITVLGSDVIVVTDAKGAVTGVFNNHDDRVASTDLTPDARLDNSAEAVGVAAAAYLASTTGQTDRTAVAAFIAASTFDPELVVYALDSSAAPRLAWRVIVEPTTISQSLGLTDPDPGATYFIYANGAEAGSVIVDTPNVQPLSTTTTARDVLGQTRQINVEDTTVWFFFHTSALSDTTRNLATYWTSYQFFGWGPPVLPGNIVNPGWFGWDASAVSAQANAAAVYDYYKNVLGLTSFNGIGAAINVSIEYNPHAAWWDYFSGFNNAFWDPTKQQLVFGNGGDLEAALDVVGHEYTHAVVSYAVGDGGSVLDYGESGALNEALADILGSLVEGKSGTGRWLIGEDSHFPGGPIRNLADPSTITTSYGPYRETYATRYTGTGDDGGEHVNSTIFSHAAYEMMTDAATSSISQQTWARVFYHALYRLSPGATFADGRAAVLDSADTLGFTAAQLDAINRAFDDVGIPTGITVLI
ncbi:M4 family metallopeptidase [Mycobacterium sp. MMS18-G62]